MAELGGRKLQQQVEEEEESLRYLEFFHAAALRTLICIFNLYVHAKQKSGPFKHGVEFVEGMVKAVVRPVYDDLLIGPMELLKFIDRKIDNVVVKLDRKVPLILKQVSTQAYKTAQALTSEVKRCGVMDTASSILRAIYTKYEPRVQQYAQWTWCVLNRLPLFRQVAKVAVPTVGYYLEKYNDAVYMIRAEKNQASANYLPLISMEKIAEVFMGDDAAESVRTWRSFCAPRTCFSFFV